MADKATKDEIRIEHGQLREVALQIFQVKTVQRRNRPVSENVRESFKEAKIFLEYDYAVEAGTVKVDEPRKVLAAPKVQVEAWDSVTNAPVIDESGNPVKLSVLADVDAFAGGLSPEHPINQAYIKGRLVLGLPIQPRFAELAKKYARELDVKPVLEPSVN